MDLAFSVNRIPYLKRLFTEVRHQEETSEAVIPDSCPDAAAIIESFASVMLRGKECRSGCATVSGAIKAGAIYQPEDSSIPQLLEFYIPFSVSFDHTSLDEGSQIESELKVTSVDARLINSRKVLMRVNVACEISAYVRDELMFHQLQSNDDRLQLKKQTICVMFPSELTERTFVVSETVEPQPGQTSVSQICKARCFCTVTDKKLVGNKAVFKGMMQCRLLYLTDNGTLFSSTVSYPFSQYCELTQDYDEGTLSVYVTVTGCDVQLDQNGTLQLTVNLLAQCLVYAKYETEHISDAYCIGGDFTPLWSDTAAEAILDQRTEPFSFRQVVPSEFHQIIDVEFYDDFPICRKTDEGVQVTFPTCIHILGYSDDQVPFSVQGRGEPSAQYGLADEACCHARMVPSEGFSVQSIQNATEVRCNYRGDVKFTALQAFKFLCGGSINDPGNQHDRKPSVILRHISEEQPLWDVAKAYRTTVHALQCANELDSEYTPDQGMLLIPIP